MNILGLIGYGFNPGAALIKDGLLVAHSEEERFTRFKGSHFLFPEKSMVWMLKENQLDFNDIDAIVWAWDQDLYRFQMPWFFLKSFFKHGLTGNNNGSAITVGAHLAEQLPGVVRQKIHHALVASGISGRIPPIHFISHHLSHAASSYYLSGFDESNILVIDGSGEKYCTSLYQGENLSIQDIEHIEIPNSLGWFYAAITEYLGFIPYRDEGKVMGLAAYGQARPDIITRMKNIISITDDGYEVNPRFTLLGAHSKGKHFSDELEELLGPRRLYNTSLQGHEKDIAYAAQHLLEQAAAALLRRLQQKNDSNNLCLAGGVTLNCKMNGFLRKQPGVNNLFVQPSANDAGSALGAALVFAKQHHVLKPQRLKHTYFGSAYSDQAIETKLKNSRVAYRHTNDIPKLVAQALSQNRIVGVFQGRAEFGARALGHRSILANPSMPDAKDIVNLRVKFRENWRPFCPSLLDEDRDKYIKSADHAPFMAIAYELKEEWNSFFPSIVHVDGSIRPQTVSEQDHPFMWKCLSELKQITGHSIVMNTSFNVRGQPIVESPEDAIACFFATGLDAMAIGNFWLEKEAL